MEKKLELLKEIMSKGDKKSIEVIQLLNTIEDLTCQAMESMENNNNMEKVIELNSTLDEMYNLLFVLTGVDLLESDH